MQNALIVQRIQKVPLEKVHVCVMITSIALKGIIIHSHVTVRICVTLANYAEGIITYIYYAYIFVHNNIFNYCADLSLHMGSKIVYNNLCIFQCKRSEDIFAAEMIKSPMP